MDSRDKRQLAKQRREAARQAQKFHKEQEKQNRKTSARPGAAPQKEAAPSKIKEAVYARREKMDAERRRHLSREELYRRRGREKLRDLKPEDHEEGYFVDEYAEKQRQERRARIIRRQEREVIHRNKKPLSHRQIRVKRISFWAC